MPKAAKSGGYKYRGKTMRKKFKIGVMDAGRSSFYGNFYVDSRQELAYQLLFAARLEGVAAENHRLNKLYNEADHNWYAAELDEDEQYKAWDNAVRFRYVAHKILGIK